MKKIMAMALAAVMSISMVACSNGDNGGNGIDEEVKTYKTGMGINTKVAKQFDAKEGNNGKVELDTTMVIASFDQDGKVVSATIDVAQQSADIDASGKIVSETDLRTKVEKGEDYGMKKFAGAVAEIDEQYASLAKWMEGKTVDEIVNMEVYAKDEKHTSVPAVEDLKSSVTIDVGSYLEGLKEAWETATETTGPVAKTGLGTVITSKEVDAGENDGLFEIATNIVGVALDTDGKIVWAGIDTAQQQAKFTVKGAFTGEIDCRTKVDKGEDYGMKKFAGAVAEINEQYASLAKWMEGKTVDEVINMEVYAKDEKHTSVPAVEDLKSCVTITVGDQLKALEKAAQNAK